jgi:hypothetical protein
MSIEETLKVCAENFVVKDFRERFVHEALKKPARLNARVSHEIEKVFDARFLNGAAKYASADECIVFGGSKAEKSTWAKASEQFGYGGGILVIGIGGQVFYAESEGEPASIVYAGNS